eukprot:4983057-Karenia_brevis.AAC.1
MEETAFLVYVGLAVRLAKHKEIMLEAANFTQKEMLLCESFVFTRSLTLFTISGPHWDQNIR